METSKLLRGLGLVVCASVAVASTGDDARARFEKELRAVYDYLPADVAQDVRDAKVVEMDGFWESVKADVETYRPLLREALADPEQNRYFLFDGAALLNEVKEDEQDVQRAADAVAKTRLEDLDVSGYFKFVHHLGCSGADISAAVLTLLDKPDLGVFLPAHSLRLRHPLCMQLCALTMDEGDWVPEFVARFRADETKAAADDVVKKARRSLFHCLTYAVHADGVALVREVAEGDGADRLLRGQARIAVRRADPGPPKGEPTTTREQFEEILTLTLEKGRLPYYKRHQEAVKDAPHHIRAGDLPRLLEARRKIARRVSDESLHEIDQVTRWLRCAERARIDDGSGAVPDDGR